MKQANALAGRGRPVKSATGSDLFLVGCPRSGTTLLQTHLARHPNIVTFPESHFFDCSLGDRGSLRKMMGVPGRGARDNFTSFALKAGISDNPRVSSIEALSLNRLTQKFLAMMSQYARDRDSVWLEKTPGHSHHIGYIKKHARGAKYIHLIRHGPDVVDSLYRVTRQYPKYWSGAWSVEKCVARWRSAIEDSLRWCDDEDAHFVIFYEDFLDQPERWLRLLLEFAGFQASDTVLQSMLVRDTVDSEHIQGFENWKLGAEEVIRYPESSLQRIGLSQAQVEDVKRELEGVDISRLREAAESRLKRGA